MTRFKQITQMNLEEVAERFVEKIETLFIKCVVSTLDMSVHNSIEKAVEHNKKWLEEEIE